MQSTQCFCSNPVSHSDSEDDYESHIYCSRACALSDAFRALTARQVTPGPGDIIGSSRLALTQEQLGYVSHYRRVARRDGRFGLGGGKFVQPNASTRSSGSEIDEDSSASTFTSPPLSASSSISSLDYLDTKPLPDLPRRETRVLRTKKTRHNLKEAARDPTSPTDEQPSFRRNISTRYPPVNPQPVQVHNRNSSLSSFADSSRFTTQTISTRATSMASTCPDDAQVVSRHPSRRESKGRLHQLAEVEEVVEVPEIPKNAWGRTAASQKLGRRDEESGITTGYIDLTSPAAESVWDMSAPYDPFELDHLLMRTPKVALAARFSACRTASADVSVEPVSPLNVPFRSQLPYCLSPVERASGFDPILAPAIELQRRPTVTKRSPTIEPSFEPTGLAPPTLPGARLTPVSPSTFPTTPSLSPFGCTPTASPQQAMEPTPKGLTFTSLTYTPPIGTEKPDTLHRRLRLEFGKEGALPLGLPGLLNVHPGLGARDQLPITPLDPQDEVRGYFERNTDGGHSRPFLEPLAGLGFEMDESKDRKEQRTPREAPGVTEALQRAATVHSSAKCSGTSSPGDDVLDYYLGRLDARDAHPSSRRTFNFL